MRLRSRIDTRQHMQLHTHTHTSTHTFTHVHAHCHTFIRMSIHTFTHTSTHTFTHAHVHAHVYTQLPEADVAVATAYTFFKSCLCHPTLRSSCLWPQRASTAPSTTRTGKASTNPLMKASHPMIIVINSM